MDLAGLVLADDLADTVRRVPFPAGFLEAGSYQQIHLDKDGWPGFALGRGEELGIWTLDGMLVDRVDWEEGQADRGTSFARVLDITGDFQTVDLPTPGAPNLNQTAIIEKGEEFHQACELRGNWPNPFNSSTTLRYILSQTGAVELFVYDVQGQLVRRLVQEVQKAGTYEITWAGDNEASHPVATGTYFTRLQAGAFTQTRKVMLIK